MSWKIILKLMEHTVTKDKHDLPWIHNLLSQLLDKYGVSLLFLKGIYSKMEKLIHSYNTIKRFLVLLRLMAALLATITVTQLIYVFDIYI